MSWRPRIGELLLLKELVEPHVLAKALKRSAGPHQRLVSKLISWGLLDPDDGALALAEQHGCHAAMQRHLERRDPGVAHLIPDALCTRWLVLPLGRARTGQLVTVARDPTPILAKALEHAAKTPILLAVTPATQLERILRVAYGMTSDPDEPLPSQPPSLAEAENTVLDPTVSTSKPFRVRTVSRLMYDEMELSPSRKRPSAPHAPQAIDATLAELAQVRSRTAAEHHVIEYAGQRWKTALLVAIRDLVASGQRGYGRKLLDVEHLHFPLSAPSIIRSAYETREPTMDAPDGTIQHRLSTLLEQPRAPAAVAVVESDRVTSVLVVGDPLSGDTRDSLADLDRLAESLGAAYTRLAP